MTEQKALSFVARCKDYFGLKPGQSLTQFAQELKGLTLEAKQELHRLFVEAGLPTEAPTEK